MRRLCKNTQRHVSQFLKVIKIASRPGCISNNRQKAMFALVQPCLRTDAQLDFSNKCRCGAPLTSSQLLECTIRTFPHPTRTQIMSAAFFPPLPLTCLCLICCKPCSRYSLYVLFHFTANYTTGLPYITRTRLCLLLTQQ